MASDNATYMSYNFLKLMQQLDKRQPVIVRGEDDEGHAFVIDGYKRKIYDVEMLFDDEGESFVDVVRCKEIEWHVNWRWGGYCNGYYKYLKPKNNYNEIIDDFTHDKMILIDIYPH